MAIRNKLLQDIVAAVGGSVSSPITRNSLLQDWLDAVLSVPSFSPLDLFQSGEQGAWYDPSDLSTLFQDDAGTTPVVSDGDPVGLMQDKSGNSDDATQSVSAARPTYRAGELTELDSVDDYFIGVDYGNPTKIGFSFAFETGSTLPGNSVLIGLQDTVGARYNLVLNTNGSTLKTFVTFSDDSQDISDFSSALEVSTKYVATFTFDDGSFEVRLNGTSLINSSGTSGALGGDANNLIIGADINNIRHSDISIHGLIVAEDITANMSDVEDYLAEKIGITL